MVTMAKKAARKAKGGPDEISTDDSGLLRTSEAAKLIGITTGVFRWHARDGKIAPRQIIHIGGLTVPLYDRGDVVALKEALRPPGGKRGRGGPRGPRGPRLTDN